MHGFEVEFVRPGQRLYNKCSAVTEIGDRLATIDMSQKFGV